MRSLCRLGWLALLLGSCGAWGQPLTSLVRTNPRQIRAGATLQFVATASTPVGQLSIVLADPFGGLHFTLPGVSLAVALPTTPLWLNGEYTVELVMVRDADRTYSYQRDGTLLVDPPADGVVPARHALDLSALDVNLVGGLERPSVPLLISATRVSPEVVVAGKGPTYVLNFVPGNAGIVDVWTNFKGRSDVLYSAFASRASGISFEVKSQFLPLGPIQLASVTFSDTRGHFIHYHADGRLESMPPIAGLPERHAVSFAGCAFIVQPPARIANVSVRATLTDSQAVKVGLVVKDGTRNVLVRAAGPGLRSFGVVDAMRNPTLALYQDTVLAVANDDWASSLEPTFRSIGAFPFGSGSADAAIVHACDGARSVVVQGSEPGTVLVEAYDLDAPGGLSRIANISARNHVGAGEDVLIAGFTITGTATKELLIRGIGPALAQFGVQTPLADPKIEIYDSTGRLRAQNDSWSISSSAMIEAGAFPLAQGSKDAGVEIKLPVGTYTAVVRGADGGAGEALVEVYELR